MSVDDQAPAYPPGHNARILEIMAELAAPRRIVEQTFLQMGERLCECTRILGEVSAVHEGMPAELASPDYAAAAQRLGEIRGEVDKLAVAYYAEQDQLRQLSDIARRVAAPIAELREAVRSIDLIATNARIVAAGFGGNNDDVVAFTSGMAQLARNVGEAVSAFSKSYDVLVANLAAARSANEAFATKHGATLSHISGKLGSQLSTLELQRADAAVRVAEHGKLTGQIRAGIGAAVSAMQIGDITRQRVEHAEQAFETFTARAAELAAGSAVHSLAAVCRLQDLQLEETVRDFDREVVELAATLGGLAKDAAAALRDSNKEAETLLSAGGTALAAMIADLGEICTLFEQFERTRAGLERIVDDVARSVAAMVDHLGSVRAIEQQIRLLSFNTTIQCGRFGDAGEGRALRVVAQQLREVSAQTVTAASATMAGLNDVDTRTRQVMQGRASLMAEKITTLGEAAVTAMGMFDAVAGRLRQRAETMLRIGPQAVELLDATARSVSGRRTLSSGWRAAQGEIAALAQEIVDADFAAADPALLADLRKRYTMESEREIHDNLFASLPVAVAAPPVVPAPAEASLDDVLF